MNADSPLPASDEMALIKRLPDLVGEGEAVAVDPHSIVGARLRLAAIDPRAGDALSSPGAHYVLHFPGKAIGPGTVSKDLRARQPSTASHPSPSGEGRPSTASQPANKGDPAGLASMSLM